MLYGYLHVHAHYVTYTVLVSRPCIYNSHLCLAIFIVCFISEEFRVPLPVVLLYVAENARCLDRGTVIGGAARIALRTGRNKE